MAAVAVPTLVVIEPQQASVMPVQAAVSLAAVQYLVLASQTVVAWVAAKPMRIAEMMATFILCTVVI